MGCVIQGNHKTVRFNTLYFEQPTHKVSGIIDT